MGVYNIQVKLNEELILEKSFLSYIYSVKQLLIIHIFHLMPNYIVGDHAKRAIKHTPQAFLATSLYSFQSI